MLNGWIGGTKPPPLTGGGGGSTVLFDAASAVFQISSGSSGSFTHTPSGTPTAAGVGIFCFTGGAGAGASSVKYGGVAMTRVVTVDSATPATSEIWGLANPASGAQAVDVIMNSAGSFAQMGAITVTGSNTTTCFTTAASATGTSSAPSLACGAQVNDLVFDFAGAASSADFNSAGGSQTIKFPNNSLGGDRAAGSIATAATTSQTMSWALGTSAAWAQVAASFKHA